MLEIGIYFTISVWNPVRLLLDWVRFTDFFKKQKKPCLVTASAGARNEVGSGGWYVSYKQLRVCVSSFLSSAPGLSPIWPSPPERRVSWLRGIVQDTGDTPFQR